MRGSDVFGELAFCAEPDHSNHPSTFKFISNRGKEYSLPEQVFDLDDGGMGSIRFGLTIRGEYGSDLRRVKYIDSDKTPVIITLIEDDQHQLFELEFWKSYFSELRQYSTPDKISLS